MKQRLVGNTQLVAGRAELISDVLDIVEAEGIKSRGNPDVFVRAYANFGIDEARELRERASLKPMGDRRVFVIATPSMTAEAQNALLKTLEEPSADALFFFIVPAPETLLATLRSRSHVLALAHESHSSKIDTKKFLAASPEARLDMLKPLLAKDDDDKRDLGSIIAFLNALEKAVSLEAQSLEAIYRARKYVSDKGALVKPLLEQVALLV